MVVEQCSAISNFLVKFGENVVKFEVTKLFEDLILTFDLGHEAIEVSMRKFGQIWELSSLTEWRNCSRLDTLSGSQAWEIHHSPVIIGTPQQVVINERHYFDDDWINARLLKDIKILLVIKSFIKRQQLKWVPYMAFMRKDFVTVLFLYLLRTDFFFSFLGRNEIENVNWIRRASNCCLRQAISCYSFFFLFDLFRWWATRETSEDWLLNVAVANIPNTGLILKETRRSTHTQNTRTHCRRTPERNKWHRLMIFGRTFVRQNVDYPPEFE